MSAQTRRVFLRASTATVGLTLVSACVVSVAPTAPTAMGPAPTAAQLASTSIKMPTYQPITIAPPDLPCDDKVESGYFAFPKKLNKTFTEPPIKAGGEVNVMTWNVTGPIAPLESNTAWQAINQQVGAKINLVNNVSNSDYRTKLTAVVAGGELPDTMYIPTTRRTERALSAVSRFPRAVSGRPDPLSQRGCGQGVP
jgi:putative aldouronate transport system substrate-binding protein